MRESDALALHFCSFVVQSIFLSDNDFFLHMMRPVFRKASQGGKVNSTEIRAIQKSLLEQKCEILNKSHEFRKEQCDRTQLADEADVATKNFADHVSIHLQEKDRLTLYQIERALSKISSGTYGQCEGCGCTIENRRLQARPFSVLCIACVEEQESTRLQ